MLPFVRSRWNCLEPRLLLPIVLVAKRVPPAIEARMSASWEKRQRSRVRRVMHTNMLIIFLKAKQITKRA